MKFTKIIAAVSALTIVGGVSTVYTEPLSDYSLISFAKEDDESGEYYEDIYNKNILVRIYSDHVEIADCNESFVGELEIPDEMLGLPVTVIGKRAFHSCKDLTKVKIPDTVTSIGENAFSFCDALTETKIPKGVTRIENGLFENCFNLRSVNIPDGVTSIGDFAFSHCENLTSVTLPDSVTSIGEYAFNFCSSISSVTIPGKVDTIEQYTFSACKNLTEVTILNPDCHFSSANCISNLSWTISFNGTICGFEGSTAQTFAKTCGYDFEVLNELPDDGKYSEGILGDLTYRKYAKYAVITDCDESAESVDVPAEIDGVPVTEIGDHAFFDCADMIEITLPDSIESIGANAFEYCLSLTVIDIPDSVTSIGESAFANCIRLVQVILPDSLTSIADDAFSYCKKLNEITIPDSVTSIGEGAFTNCKALTEITIPKSVVSIGYAAFMYCSELDKIIILNPGCEIYDSDHTISTGSDRTRTYFDGTIYGLEDSTAQAYAEKYSCQFDTVANIHTERNQGNLIYWKYFDHIAIAGCRTYVTEVNIPDKIEDLPVTVIGDSAFENCSDMTKVRIPDSVTSIGERAFYKCTELAELTIPAGVTEIGDSAFYQCKSLDEIKIPDGVTEIGIRTFFGCNGLTSITIPDAVTSIGDGAFAWCVNLTEITIPESVKKIVGQAFTGTKWLENRQAEDPLVTVNNILIDGSTCEGKVTVPDGVAEICDYAFFGNKTLTEITTPDSLTEIGFFAFGECTALTKVTLSAGVASIDDSAFSYCGNLTEITILNPNCDINESKYTISNGNDQNYNAYYSGVIRGYDNSTAQAYAEKHGYKFESLGEAPEQFRHLKGDANCDGEVTIADAAAILQYLGNNDKFPISEQGLRNADVDGTAGVTTKDALTIQMFKSGLVSELPLDKE